MCGIAGLLGKDVAGTSARAVDALLAALGHRGPDGHGAWASVNGEAAFVHTRLAIIDLSDAGRQPMSTPDGRLTITFNGEIYNYRGLRASLERDGVGFRTHSDTEVVLRLYERYGAKAVDMLRGMFAFAIWDERERACFLARDPLGIKPLYYVHSRGRLAFASELKALQAAGLVGSDLDPAALVGYFETGTVAEPRTLLREARSLRAGHTMTWKDDTLATERYWAVSFEGEAIDRARAIELLREAMLDSVRHHFVSDVPVGIFLSGGIDSTALVALARQAGIEDIATFSIGVDDPRLDESSVARRTADHFGTRHAELRLDEERGAQLFERFLGSIDQPTVDGFNTYTVSSLARSHGLKVVLSGLGGDELFGGYASFTQVPRLARFGALLGLAPPVRRALGSWLETRARSGRARRVGSFLQGDPDIPSAYRAARGIFSRRDATALAGRYADGAQGPPSEIRLEGPAPTPGDEVSGCEISLYMRNQLLRDSDVMSMAHGLELRVPFVDRTLIEAAARVPAAIRLQPGKAYLLAAVPEIPAWVAGAPKRGFTFPFEAWIRSGWQPLFDRAAADLPVPRPAWYQTWSVFMLDWWLRERGIVAR